MSMIKAFNNKCFSDIVFVFSDNTEIYAHRNVLCCASSFFETMFISSGMLESQQVKPGEQIAIRVPETYSQLIYELVLRYCYGGEIQLMIETVVPVCAVAQMYSLEGLMQKCLSFAGNRQSWPSFKDLVYASHDALHSHCDNLLKAMVEILSERCEQLCKSEDLLSFMEEDMLLQLLQSKVLKLSHHSRFKMIVLWGKLQQAKDGLPLSQIISESLKWVDFKSFSVQEMKNVIYPNVGHLTPNILSNAFQALIDVSDKEVKNYSKGFPVNRNTILILENGTLAQLSDRGGLVKAGTSSDEIRNFECGYSSSCRLSLNGSQFSDSRR